MTEEEVRIVRDRRSGKSDRACPRRVRGRADRTDQLIPSGASFSMAIEVRIPTILRTYTGGEKPVEASRRHPRRRCSTTWTRSTRACAAGWSPTTARCTGSSTSTSTTRTCASSARWTPSCPTVTTVTILPAVAGGALDDSPDGTEASHALREPARRSATPRWSACRACRPCRRRRAAVGEAGGPQPDRLGQGPGRDLCMVARRRSRTAGCGPAPRSSSRPAATPASRWRWSRKLRGYRLVCVMPENISVERRQLLRDVRRGDHLLAGRGRLQPGGRRWRSRSPPSTPTG